MINLLTLAPDGTSAEIRDFRSTGGNSFTFDLLRNDDVFGDYTITIPVAAFQDDAGNTSPAARSLTITFTNGTTTPPPDTTDPTTEPTITPRRSSSSSGGGSHSSPPRLSSFGGGGIGASDHPITINGQEPTLAFNGFSGKLASPVTAVVGESVTLTLNLQDPDGPSQIKHIGVYLNLKDDPKDYWQSDVYLVYERFATNQFTVRDTNGNVEFATYEVINDPDTNAQQFKFTVIFSKPIGLSGMAIHSWDNHNSASLFTIPDAVKITTINGDIPSQERQPTDVSTSGDTNDATTNVDANTNADTSNADAGDTATPVIAAPDETQGLSQDHMDTISQWLGYETTVATDHDMLRTLDIIDTDTSTTDTASVKLPDWAKKYLGQWIVSGTISYDEFVDIMAYIYEKTTPSTA
jgi:hypothetical protein